MSDDGDVQQHSDGPVKKRDLVAEIEEIRSRAWQGAYPVTVPLRLRTLASAFSDVSGMDPELLRYVPIGVVACYEGFFRSAVRTLVDAGTPYAENARQLGQVRDMRLDLEVLGAVHGQRISVGELVAHVVSINSVEHLDGILSTILGRNFFEELRTVKDRWATEVEKKPSKPIIDDWDGTFKRVSEMFRLRHIYAHETVDLDVPDRDEITRGLEASVTFLSAAAALMGDILHPNAALTQADMNERAARDVDSLDARIEAVVEKICETAPDRREYLKKSQEAWTTFRAMQAKFESETYSGGSIYSTIYGGVILRLSKARLADLEGVLAEEKRASDL